MTPIQKSLIRESYSALAADVDASAALFYAYLFEADPSLRRMFSVSIRTQGRKFMAMMSALLDCLDRLDSIVPLLWQMGKRHGEYGVTDAHYVLAGNALIRTLESRAGKALPPETIAAWTELYALIVRAMQYSAAEASRARPPIPSPDEPFETS